MSMVARVMTDDEALGPDGRVAESHEEYCSIGPVLANSELICTIYSYAAAHLAIQLTSNNRHENDLFELIHCNIRSFSCW